MFDWGQTLQTGMQLLLLFAVELRHSALCCSLADLIINLPIMLQISIFSLFKSVQTSRLTPDLLRVVI